MINQNNNKSNKNTTMKKTIVTIAIVLGLTMTSFASGGLFQRGVNADNGKSGYVFYKTDNGYFMREDGVPTPLLPGHGSEVDQPAPLGSGIAVLLGLGAAYLVGKKRREE